MLVKILMRNSYQLPVTLTIRMCTSDPFSLNLWVMLSQRGGSASARHLISRWSVRFSPHSSARARSAPPLHGRRSILPLELYLSERRGRQAKAGRSRILARFIVVNDLGLLYSIKHRLTFSHYAYSFHNKDISLILLPVNVMLSRGRYSRVEPM
jgi:hypothetical protein